MKKALPMVHQQYYEAFQRRLEQISQTIAALLSEDAVMLQPEIVGLQNFFREQILALPMDELPLTLQHWVQSYQVECDKQLRLLSLDVMLLRAARQPATHEQRLQQVSDRLSTLQRYCAAVLEKSEE